MHVSDRNDSQQRTVARVQSILASKDLTLHRVAKVSERLYGNALPFRIPHNLYHSLVSSHRFGPSLYQMSALSRITAYRLNDWLRVFGIEVEAIPRLQSILPTKRTVLLDTPSSEGDSCAMWFRDRPGGSISQGIVPLGRLLEATRQPVLFASDSNQRLNYAKVGCQDALAFPDLLPGSIVRVDRDVTIAHGEPSRIFLVECAKGIWCSRLYVSKKDRIHAISAALAYGRIELQIPSEARILGVVNMEYRWVASFQQPVVPREFAEEWRPEKLKPLGGGLGNLLQHARMRSALSFREASALSKRIAAYLDDERYFAAPGSLSDYEAQDFAPRQMQKAITLCVLYGIPFLDFVRAAGVTLADLGKEAIPRGEAYAITGDWQRRNPLLTALIEQFGEVPWFLRGAVKELSGVRHLSLRDLFWIECENDCLSPHMRGSMMVLVNRRKKSPRRLRSMPVWQQPMYVLRTTDGKYLCASCSLSNRVLVLYPEPDDRNQSAVLHHLRDVEVVGEVVAIARRFT